MRLAKNINPALRIRTLLVTGLAWGALTAANSSGLWAQASEAQAANSVARRDRVELTLEGAQQAIEASRQQAATMGVLVNIAVVDDGGHLLAFARMNGARPASVYTAITKATSAATQRGPTGPLRPDQASGTHLSLAVESAAAISGGKFTTLKGGIPIVCDGQVIGAVGVGGATGEQDAEVAAAGVARVVNAFDAETADVAASTPAGVLPAALVGNWLVEDIEGRGVIDNAQTTIQFDPNGLVSGSTGVNRYSSQATVDGESLQLADGPTTTRAAGPPALMDQEAKFLAALHKVAKVRVDDNGLLHLYDAQGKPLLRASLITD